MTRCTCIRYSLEAVATITRFLGIRAFCRRPVWRPSTFFGSSTRAVPYLPASTRSAMIRSTLSGQLPEISGWHWEARRARDVTVCPSVGHLQFCGFENSGRKAKMKDGGKRRLTKRKKLRRTMSEPPRVFAEGHGGQGTPSVEIYLDEGRETNYQV